MKRKIIRIDEEKCNGCGLCIPNCQEGALQIINGKVRLVSDLFCDGLGACIGFCPEGAIEIEEREAEPYDERKVMEIISTKGRNTILAHLDHFHDHNEEGYLKEAITFIKENNIDMSENEIKKNQPLSHGCPGAAAMDFRIDAEKVENSVREQHPINIEPHSELRQWPVQLHLINPNADYFDNADLLISADCVPYAYGDFHKRFLKGKIVITFCPKLDGDIDRYIDKLAHIFTLHEIKSVNIVRMEVPCCGGTEMIVKKALEQASI